MSSDVKPEKSVQAGLPLFYKSPEPLRADAHAGLRLNTEPNFRFAAASNAVPLMTSEFIAGARRYPIVFAGEPVMPMAVLGLQEKNLFVSEEGKWEGNQFYVPAYVRRYPFCFIQQNETFILAVDKACDRLVENGKDYKTAQPLFAGGKPTALTEDALRFCGALQTDHVATRAFTTALVEQNLLIEQAAQAVSGHGRRYNLQGFRIVDVNRFMELPEAVVLDWHRKGWLGLVYAHLASLMAWKDLVFRIGAQEEQGERSSQLEGQA